MRRKDLAIESMDDILNVVDDCMCLRIAFQDEKCPYIVPVNFGYSYEEDKLVLYYHSASEGRKVNLSRLSNMVAFEMDCGHIIYYNGKENETIACKYTNTYKSVMGEGKIREVTTQEEKLKCMNLIMGHCAGKNDWDMEHMPAMERTLIFAIDVDSVTGKIHK